jgi:hypothetical protein
LQLPSGIGITVLRVGVSTSGKLTDFDSVIPRFES